MPPIISSAGSASGLPRPLAQADKHCTECLFRAKRVSYRSAFCAISCHGPSQEYYRRKRAEGEGTAQAIVALARRRVNVLWAMLRDGAIYEDRTVPRT